MPRILQSISLIETALRTRRLHKNHNPLKRCHVPNQKKIELYGAIKRNIKTKFASLETCLRATELMIALQH